MESPVLIGQKGCIDNDLFHLREIFEILFTLSSLSFSKEKGLTAPFLVLRTSSNYSGFDILMLPADRPSCFQKALPI
jgi:hypothetical protein